MQDHRVRQPLYYETFHCLGADCEDTCCNGWRVMVDRGTYERYQNCSNPELQPSLTQLITINAARTGDDDYASITPTGTQCPFLSDGLCSVQQKLGEDYLSKACATYPRVFNVVDGVLERSLELSCPEAARLALLNPNPIEFEELQDDGGARLGNLAFLVTSDPEYPDKPYRHFHEVRRLVVSLLQNRQYPLSDRLVILAYLCDKLNEMAVAHDPDGVPEIVQKYADAIDQGLFNDLLSQSRAQPATQLEIVLELLVSRITSDFTPRRFLECYAEFMHGINLSTSSVMADVAVRYAEAYRQYYLPFMSQHESIMERLLVSYVYKTLFPFGPQESTQKLSLYRRDSSISVQYMLMVLHYAVMKALLIGMSGYHKSGLTTDHVIKLIQSYTKTFEHSTAFPPRAIEILKSRGLHNAATMAVLIQN